MNAPIKNDDWQILEVVEESLRDLGAERPESIAIELGKSGFSIVIEIALSELGYEVGDLC